MSFLSSVGSILTGGAALIGAIKGGGNEGKKSAQIGQQQSQFAFDLSKALTDPTSALFQNLYQAEQEAARKAYLSGLESLFVADRRERARGGIGGNIVNPSRRDETFAHLLGRQRELGSSEAAERARAALAAGAGVLYNNPAYTSLAQSNIGQSQRDVLAAGAEGFGTVLSGLEGIFRNRPSAAPTTQSVISQGSPVSRLPGPR